MDKLKISKMLKPPFILLVLGLILYVDFVDKLEMIINDFINSKIVENNVWRKKYG